MFAGDTFRSVTGLDNVNAAFGGDAGGFFTFFAGFAGGFDTAGGNGTGQGFKFGNGGSFAGGFRSFGRFPFSSAGGCGNGRSHGGGGIIQRSGDHSFVTGDRFGRASAHDDCGSGGGEKIILTHFVFLL